MYLGGDWEYWYASGLVDFAVADGDARRTAAEALLTSFDSQATFNEGELQSAHSRARRGLVAALHWQRLPPWKRKRWLRALDSVLPYDLGAVVAFSLLDVRAVPRGDGPKDKDWMTFTQGDPHKGGLRMSVTRTTGQVSLLNAVALGLALLVGDESRWRSRFARCRLPICRKLFIAGGLGKGKPTVTCCKEHAQALHKIQMRVKNGLKNRPRDKSLLAEKRDLRAAKLGTRDFSSPKLWP